MLRPDGPPASPAGGEPRARFGRANRLVRGWQYQRTFREGRSERGECVVAYAHVVPGEPSRVGIIASRKVGNAVLRNRAKRRLRECFRHWKRGSGPALDLVLVAKKELGRGSAEEVEREYRQRLQRLEKRAARMGGPHPPARD